uniref:Nuclear receptor domain-containing protein n=1 Tax=Steinernema glaseri TaxID=37863 RepID=A0A1I7YY70_9BILA
MLSTQITSVESEMRLNSTTIRMFDFVFVTAADIADNAYEKTPKQVCCCSYCQEVKNGRSTFQKQRCCCSYCQQDQKSSTQIETTTSTLIKELLEKK